MGDLEFHVDGLEQFSEVVRAFTRIDRSIPRDVLKVIKKEATALKKEAAALVLLEPTHGKKHTGLRKKVSKGVRVIPVEEDGSKGFRITTEMPEEDEAIIPHGFDSPRKYGWRHPFFGDKERRFVTRGEFSWFYATMRQANDHVKPKIEDILEDAADQVDKAAKRGG